MTPCLVNSVKKNTSKYLLSCQTSQPSTTSIKRALPQLTSSSTGCHPQETDNPIEVLTYPVYYHAIRFTVCVNVIFVNWKPLDICGMLKSIMVYVKFQVFVTSVTDYGEQLRYILFKTMSQQRIKEKNLLFTITPIL